MGSRKIARNKTNKRKGNKVKKISRKHVSNVFETASKAVKGTPSSPKEIAERLQPLIDRLSGAEAWDESETWNDDAKETT